MKISYGTNDDLIKALEIVNKKYDNNIIFNRFDYKKFTLKVINNREPGHLIKKYYIPSKRKESYDLKERHLSYACWHVHGDFFDALFSINPNAIIYSARRKITINEGNWKDWNVGSTMSPMYFSECCNCEE